MLNNVKTVVSVDEKNRWLGKLAYGALVSLALAQYDGKTTRNPHSENLFLLRWLQTALKQKRFHRCVAGDCSGGFSLVDKFGATTGDDQ